MDQLSVRVGSSTQANGGSVLQMSRIIMHPNYDSVKTNFDFGLLELAKPLNFTDKIQPIAIPNADLKIADETVCITSGWGTFKKLHEITNRIYKDFFACYRSYRSNESSKNPSQS